MLGRQWQNGDFLFISDHFFLLLLLTASFSCEAKSLSSLTRLSDERIVFQTDFGSLELALYPEAAPLTVKHILSLARLGGYNTNDFFRVDKGFVAQTSAVSHGRSCLPDERVRDQDLVTVPLEVHAELKHTKRGLLSMARTSDPNSGGSSFSLMLGPAPHLDMQYTVFGEVVRGIETLSAMEEVETTTSGIFVMPKERIEIRSSYVYSEKESESSTSTCKAELEDLQARFNAQAAQLQKTRSASLP